MLVNTGDVKIEVNGDPEKSFAAPAGDKLLNSCPIREFLFHLPVVEVGGSCGQCRVTLKHGGSDILPTELAYINKREARAGCRLACQVNVKQDL